MLTRTCKAASNRDADLDALPIVHRGNGAPDDARELQRDPTRDAHAKEVHVAPARVERRRCDSVFDSAATRADRLRGRLRQRRGGFAVFASVRPRAIFIARQGNWSTGPAQTSVRGCRPRGKVRTVGPVR
jgi:hypothetical protein